MFLRLLPLALAILISGDAPAAPPARVPAEVDPAGVPRTDRLAAWVPADAAAVFFDSIAAAEKEIAGIAAALPGALPVLAPEKPTEGGALGRATEMLLLPSIWRANPAVRTGTRQVALVVSDLDLGRAPDLALVVEVDDATLVRTQRAATFTWEDRTPRRLRVEGLDAWSDDGSVRSFFALEGGVAVWSTTRALRARVLAAGAASAPSLLRPDARAWALARTAFPAAEGGALLVVPDAMLARLDAAPVRGRRAASLRCAAARSQPGGGACPSGGTIDPGGRGGASCSIHGTAAHPVPLGDLPEAAPPADGVVDPADPVASGAIPAAVQAAGGRLRALVPPGAPGRAFEALVESLRRDAPAPRRIESRGHSILEWGTR